MTDNGPCPHPRNCSVDGTINNVAGLCRQCTLAESRGDNSQVRTTRLKKEITEGAGGDVEAVEDSVERGVGRLSAPDIG